MNSVEHQDAQRIALVATLATRMYAGIVAAIGPNGWPAGLTDEIVMRGSVTDARKIVQFTEEALRTPTGDA